MKRTTYIFIGLFVAGLCVLVGGMFLMHFTGKPYVSNSIDLTGKQVTEELPSCRVIQFAQANRQQEEYYIRPFGSVFTINSSADGKNVLSCSDKVNSYLKKTVVGDTLKVIFDYPMDQIKQQREGSMGVRINLGDMQLHMSPDVECIINDNDNQTTVLKDLAMDSLAISVSTALAVNSCEFAVLNIMRSGWDPIDFQTGNIDNLHLNLDMIQSWNVHVGSCRIGTEYLTGHQHNIHLQKGECERVFWIPAKDDSHLNIVLENKACITMMKD